MDVPKHHCPGCGTELAYFARYPWYFCEPCLKSATDRKGRTLVFGNAAMSGGISWYYAGDKESGEDDCGAVGCIIRGREVLITEARFGGIVAQPVNREMLSDKLRRRGTNLTG